MQVGEKYREVAEAAKAAVDAIDCTTPEGIVGCVAFLVAMAKISGVSLGLLQDLLDELWEPIELNHKNNSVDLPATIELYADEEAEEKDNLN